MAFPPIQSRRLMAHLCAGLLDNIQFIVNDDPRSGPRAALAFKPAYVRGNVSNAAGGQFPPSTKMEGRCTKKFLTGRFTLIGKEILPHRQNAAVGHGGECLLDCGVAA